MSQNHARTGSLALHSERREPSDDTLTLRPSQDSQNSIVPPMPPRPLEPRASSSVAPAAYHSRREYERAAEETPPPRNPSGQQLMRWGAPPPPTRYGWEDDRRPYYGNDPFDHSGPDRGTPIGVPSDYYEEPYYKRRYRPQAPMQEPTPFAGEPPRSPPPPRRRPHWQDPYDDGGTEGTPKRNVWGGARNSPAPEEILRLPFTMWMNSNAKNRESCNLPRSNIAN